MRTSRIVPVLVSFVVLFTFPPGNASATPETTGSGKLVQKLTEAAGAAAAAKLDGVLKLEVETEETTSDGKSHKVNYTAWVNPASWIQRRIQINPKVVIGFDGKNGWAIINGQNDTRPQTPLQARGTINRYLFPVLLPFSLDTPKLVFGPPEPGKWENDPAVQLTLGFPPNFFYTPIMDTQWMLTLNPEKTKVLGVEFRPPQEYVKLGAEGIRYYVLTRKTIEGVTLPTKLLAVAIDADGNESGHVKTYSVTVTKVEGDVSLFLSPEALKAIGEGDV